MMTPLKISFINVPWQIQGRTGVRAGSRWPHLKIPEEGRYMPFPFFLAYAAALLQRHGFSVQLIDAIAAKYSYAETQRRVTEFQPDIIFAETSTVTLAHDIAVLTAYRCCCRYLALCGPDSSLADPALLAAHPAITCLLYGEYEATALAVAQTLRDKSSLAHIDGIIYRDGAAVKKNKPRALIKNIDWLPWPLRRQLPMYQYCDAPCGIPEPCGMMWASRGCPFRCSFCLWPQVMYGGNTYRARSIVDIVDEMEYMIKRLRFNSIYFDDDTWNVGGGRMREFCAELRRRNFSAPWAIMASTTLMDHALLREMRDVGLFAVKYGVESASPMLLRNVNKGVNLDKLKDIVCFTSSLGIRVHLTFTFGLPGETRKTANATLALARELNPFSVQFSLATPFPGTRFYQQMHAQNMIVSYNPEHYDGNYGAVIRTAALSPPALLSIKKRAYRQWARHCWQREHVRCAWPRVQWPLQRAKRLLRAGLSSLLGPTRRLAGGLLRSRKQLITAMRGWHPRGRQMREEQRLLRGSRASVGNCGVVYNDRQLHLLWHEHLVSRGVGLTTSFCLDGRWYDSSQAIWQQELFTERNLKFSLQWPAANLSQSWELALREDTTITWRTELSCLSDSNIREYKTGLMLPVVFDTWHDGTGVGLFPPAFRWEEIGIYNADTEQVKISAHYAANRHQYPILDMELSAASQLPARLQLQNTDRRTNARLIQMRCENKNSLLSAGTYAIELRLRFSENVPRQQPLIHYRQPVAFQWLKEKILARGVLQTVRRVLGGIAPRRFWEHYGEILGVMDGAYAYRGPRFVQIDLTNDCNNDCIGCWCNSDLLGPRKKNATYRRQRLSSAVTLDTLRTLARMGTNEIYFAGGGEPFMHPDILKIVGYVKHLGMRCYINTNFTLVDEAIADQLIKVGLDHMVVSLWAATPQTYVRTHPNKSPETFTRIVQTLQYIKKHKRASPHINCYNVISAANYQELEQMLDLAVLAGADSVEFTVIDTIPGATDVLLLSDNQRQEVARQCERIAARLRTDLKDRIVIQQFDQFVRRVNNDDARSAAYDRAMLEHMPCYIGWTFSRIMADGDVNFCLKTHRIPVGNLYTAPFSALWNGEKQRQFRSITAQACKNHTFFSFVGNDPSVPVGCFKSCDDMDRITRLYKKIQSLSQMEKTLLRGVLLGAKFRRALVRNEVLPQLQRRLFKKNAANRLSYGALEIRQNSGAIAILYQGQELTRQVGVNSAIRIHGMWHDSSRAAWTLIKKSTSQHRLTFEVIWKHVPMREQWDITLSDEKTVHLYIKRLDQAEMSGEEEQVSILLSSDYDTITLLNKRITFPPLTGWQDIVLPEAPVVDFGVLPVTLKGVRQPGILWTVQEPAGLFQARAQNTDRFSGARIIAAHRRHQPTDSTAGRSSGVFVKTTLRLTLS